MPRSLALRRAPRVHVHPEHELATVWLVSRVERNTPYWWVLSERECRHQEAGEEGRSAWR